MVGYPSTCFNCLVGRPTFSIIFIHNKNLYSPNINKMDKARVYTPSQVEQHSSKNDIWLTINGRVMDVTKFLEEHPGGEEVLMEHAGKDASKAFEAIGHSKEAHNLLAKFQVGHLQGYNSDDSNAYEELPKGREMEAYVLKDDSTSNNNSILVEFVAPVLVAGIYFGYRCMTGAVA